MRLAVCLHFFESDFSGQSLATLASFAATCELLKLNSSLWSRDSHTRLQTMPVEQLATLLSTAAKYLRDSKNPRLSRPVLG
jgi:hypothetical protein